MLEVTFGGVALAEHADLRQATGASVESAPAGNKASDVTHYVQRVLLHTR